ncbi:MAG: N-acetyltransferase [Spirosoma sp.]|nr:N-acetyltransferase [Spirosoma sp.]
MITKPVPHFQLVLVADVERLALVARRAYADHYLHLWHDGGEWYMNRSFSVDVLLKELQDSNARFYFVSLKDEPVGFLKLNINEPSPCNTSMNALELERIYLEKKVTGMGVGKAAMQFAIDQARQTDKQFIWLKAMDTSHDVLAFYGRMGFETCGTDRLSFDVMKEDFRGMTILQRRV